MHAITAKGKGIPDLSSSCVRDCAGLRRWSWSPRRWDWHARNVWRARRISQRRWTRTCAATKTTLCPWRPSRYEVCPLVFRALNKHITWKHWRVQRSTKEEDFIAYRVHAGWRSCRTDPVWVSQCCGVVRSTLVTSVLACSAQGCAG